MGAGSWGTALALTAARNAHDVWLWARSPEVAAAIAASRVNAQYLQGVALPPNVSPTASLRDALDGASVVITVVPSHGARAIYREMRPYLSHRMVLVSATKGIENETLMRMSEVVWDELRDCFDPRFVVLSGPSFAVEVARGEPTAIVAASYREEWGHLVQRELSSGSFRIYTNTDVAGVELGGSVKNVIAIATGAVRGLGLGLNSVAAIVTRGLAEMTRLAVATGGRVETLAGLAGLGLLGHCSVVADIGQVKADHRVGGDAHLKAETGGCRHHHHRRQNAGNLAFRPSIASTGQRYLSTNAGSPFSCSKSQSGDGTITSNESLGSPSYFAGSVSMGISLR